MDQTLDARLQFDEGAVVGDVGDAAGEPGTDRILRLDALPRVGLELLHAQRDALGLGVEADDLDVDRLADLQGLGRMVDAPPGDIGNVQQAIDTAQIDECAVIGDVLDHAFQNLAFLEVGDQFRTRLGACLFEDGPARYHDVAAAAVHLEDLEGLRRAHERRNVAHRADVHLAARQERHGAGQIDDEAPLDPAEDDAVDPLAVVERLLEVGPCLFAARLFAAQRYDPFAVLEPLDEDVDVVARLQFGILPGRGEFLQTDAAFGLQADVDQNHVVFDLDDGSLDHTAFEAAIVTEGFFEKIGEIFVGAGSLFGSGDRHFGTGIGFSRHHVTSILVSIRSLPANRLYPAVLVYNVQGRHHRYSAGRALGIEFVPTGPTGRPDRKGSAIL